MTKRALPLSPLAGTAIAAVLALSATPVFAQETAPAAPAEPVVVSQPEPVAAPAPAAAPVLTSEPIVQAVPETPANAASEPAAPVAAVPERSSARTAATSRAASAASAAGAAPTAATDSAAVPTPTVTIPEIAAAPAPVAPPVITADPASAEGPQTAVSEAAAIGFGLLGLAALGGAGFMATRRRRSQIQPMDRSTAPRRERMVDPAPRPLCPAPVAAPVTAAPLLNREASANVTYDRVAPTRDTAATTGGSQIPSGPLPTGEAAVALFERMANAAPDEANPFTSVKRRRKRARWLLKQHEYALRRNATAGFDYRTYEPTSRIREREGFAPELQTA